MTHTKMIGDIKNWFQKMKSVDIILPTGHFGRPHDCFFCLKSIYAEDNKIFIELVNDLTVNTDLESPLLFVFQGFMQIQFIDNCLEIYNFQSLLVQTHSGTLPYGERLDGKKIQPETHIKEYDEGMVRFIPYESPFNPNYRP